MGVDRRARRAFLAVLGLAGVAWLALGAGLTFFADEWAFIETRSLGDPVDWLRPHNEHWSTLPIVAYRLLVETVGIGSYLPYQLVVLALHLALAGLVFRLVERRCGSVVALVAGSLVAFFGAGFENVIWAFQVGTVAALVLGLAAVDLMDGGRATRRRAWLAAGLLTLSLMSSGTGVLMIVLVGTTWALDRELRRYLGVLALPAVVFTAWLVVFGRSGVATFRSPFTLEALADAPPFVLTGLGAAAAGITGLGTWLGMAAGLAVIAWALNRVRQRTLPPLAGGALVSILAQYALIGLTRGGLAVDRQFEYPRYTYISGILLLLAVTSLLGHPRRPRRVAVRVLVTAAVVVLAATTISYNSILLFAGRSIYLDRADMTRALVTAGLERPLPPTTDPDRSLVLVPSPNALERIVAEYGDPRRDVVWGPVLRAIPPAVQAEAKRRVAEGAPLPSVGP